MKFFLLLAAAALCSARPQDSAPEVVAILRDDRVPPSEAGEYSFDVETADGLVRSESGTATGVNSTIVSQGSWSYTAPDGTPVSLTFVADHEGYKPESDLLPVAPEFPHEIPQFVLDQIAKAAEEDAAA